MGLWSWIKRLFGFEKKEIPASVVQPMVYTEVKNVPIESLPEIKPAQKIELYEEHSHEHSHDHSPDSQPLVAEGYKKDMAMLESSVDPKIIDALKLVLDPELGVDIWTLELVYDIQLQEKNVEVFMTFTSPMCPFGPQLVEDVRQRLKDAGYAEPQVEVVFDPVWHPSENVKEILGLA